MSDPSLKNKALEDAGDMLVKFVQSWIRFPKVSKKI